MNFKLLLPVICEKPAVVWHKTNVCYIVSLHGSFSKCDKLKPAQYILNIHKASLAMGKGKSSIKHPKVHRPVPLWISVSHKHTRFCQHCLLLQQPPIPREASGVAICSCWYPRDCSRSPWRRSLIITSLSHTLGPVYTLSLFMPWPHIFSA